MTEVLALRVGHCRQLAAFAQQGEPWRMRAFHAHAYRIMQRDGVCWLFDTGYAEHFHTATAHGAYRLYSTITPASCPVPLHRQLEDLGGPSVGTIFVSHFHADHIAGLLDFPDATVLCSRRAWEDVRGRRGLDAVLRAFLPALVPADVEQRLRFVEDGIQVGLPASMWPFTVGWQVGVGLIAVDLPGHAAGHVGLYVADAEPPTLLAGDAAWSMRALCTGGEPHALGVLIQHDRAAYRETLARLRLLLRGGTRIRLSHDDSPDHESFLR